MFLLLLFIATSCIASSPTHEIKNISYHDFNLYPVTQSFNGGFLQVTQLHRIYFAEFGNPNGVPVLIVHGGPGWGCSALMSQYFDPTHYRIIMLDQRGSGKSVPAACMEDNSPQISVGDMETLRNHLQIEKWILFGGSYGTLLALLYGETHPERVSAFVLRGICLGREQDYTHLFYDMGKFFPEAYADFVACFAQEEKKDLITAMYQRMMSNDTHNAQAVADGFMYYDLLCARLYPEADKLKADLDKIFVFNVTRAFAYYSYHKFFLEENQLLNNIERIKDIPAYIVHGRYDLVCPPSIAYDLYAAWPSAELRFIGNGAHSGYEPAIAQALKSVMDDIQHSTK
jgi:proline iminopeptidase